MRRFPFLLLIMLLLLTGACAGKNSAETPAHTLPAGPAVAGEDLTMEGADGLALATTLYKPEGDGPFPGAILLHMLGGNRKVWEETGVSSALVRAGYAALAVDMRGHGDTGGAADWTLAAADLQRVWEAFAARNDVDEARTAIIGGSIEANMALITAAALPGVRGVVLLSPGLDYRGVTTEDRLPAYGERPLLLAASEDDPYAAESANTLAGEAAGDAQVQIYQSAGHGTNMLTAEPELTPLIIDWLNRHVAGS